MSDPNQNDSSIFPATRWTLVGHLKDPGESGILAKKALDHLCKSYWYPLYVYARRFGLDEDGAKDIVQDLFARLIEGNYMAQAEAAKGKLRNFLLTSLKFEIGHLRERERAAKRGGGRIPESLDLTDAEGRYVLEPESQEADPERAFERKWALQLLERTRDVLRDTYVRDGKGPLFDLLSPALSEGDRWGGHAEAAVTLGMNEGAVRVALSRLRKRYAEALRAEVASTVGDDGDVKAELAYLIGLFGPG
ncbi:RNA polymerase sigma factor [Brevifollis gellanilyticus]|uniref:RNA polymerase subunit sigma-24 n=1 Tax=Brevifollis gellanilyticus TaxID=748831 RepID=A0A512MHR7_9BACT|nr:sigma-70 family RNA polymerase sigma factor [Brevifollis gellanilyticus]GEP46283.1 RNA polymerase subunit sigma-24 [Brevifollis gellanilyticus]